MNVETVSTPTKSENMSEHESSENSENHNDSSKENNATGKKLNSHSGQRDDNFSISDDHNQMSILDVMTDKWIKESTSTPFNRKTLPRMISQGSTMNESDSNVPIDLGVSEDNHVPGLSFLLDGMTNMNLHHLGEFCGISFFAPFYSLTFRSNSVR
jgi:hypothetical protein